MKEQLVKIVDYLIDSTESGDFIWSYCKDHCGNKENIYYVQTILEDSDAKISIAIHIDNSGNLDKKGSIVIHHKEMTGGFEVYNINDAKNIHDLEQVVFNKCQSIFSTNKVKNPLDSILNTISLQYKRDKKIDSILELSDEDGKANKKKFLGIF
jgi:predicted RNase H-related nuclease YkuK (DUF458 family)